MTVIPAYGRDYKSAKEVKAAWFAGQDFIIADHFNKYDGKPCNIEDCAGLAVTARYRGLRLTVVLQKGTAV